MQVDIPGGAEAAAKAEIIPMIVQSPAVPLAEKMKAFDDLPPMKLHGESTPVKAKQAQASWSIATILASLALIACIAAFGYFLFMSPWVPFPETGTPLMYEHSSTKAEAKMNGMIGFGIASALCLGTLFYLKKR